MAEEGRDDAYDKGAPRTINPAITYTRTRKTKTAASSTRRRNNTAASTTGNIERAYKYWTDDKIRSHLVSGGASKGDGGSLSMVGDLIQGNYFVPTKKRSHHERNNNKKRQLGPRFAWEEEEEDDVDYQSTFNDQNKSIMRAAPTLQDIMDEQDEIDLLPQQLRKNDAGHTPRNRRENAALAELGQIFDNASKFGGVTVADNSTTDSIGWKLLRVLGYRARLGVAFVTLPGHSSSIDNEGTDDLMDLTKNLSSKHLASKGLRAIRLPSMTKKSTLDGTKPSNDQVITIPPPKTNKYGIGYDPFKNAPEFRAFKEKRDALAKRRGREADRNDSSRSNAYFTDNLRRGNRQHLWDKNSHENDNGNNEPDHHSGPDNDQHMNFAAQDYTDFIGTKASSGFALEDEDDANVYQDDDLGVAKVAEGSIDHSQYTLEIQSPDASDAEDENNHDGLFHHSVSTSERKSHDIDKSDVEDAWNAWGVANNEAATAVTSDGRPPLPGFHLGQKTNDTTKRWSGPMLPSGYILKKHVFPVDSIKKTIEDYSIDNFDCGLGLDLNQSQKRPHSSLPSLMSKSIHQQQPGMLARNGTTYNFEAVKESMKSRFVSSASDAMKPDIEKDLKDEDFVHVTSSNWLPSRLLCKRWGISQPSYSNTTFLAEKSGNNLPRGEEVYFNTTVLPQHRGDNGLRQHMIGMKPTKREEHNYSEKSLNEDYHVQPPLRPSEHVYKTIFDDESDMDISSSDDDNEDGIGNSVATNETHMHRNIGCHEFADKPINIDVNRHSPSSSEGHPPHESNKSRHQMDDRHERKKRRRRRPHKSPDHSDDTEEHEHDKKRKKKKKKKRHKRSHSYHKEKRRR